MRHRIRRALRALYFAAEAVSLRVQIAALRLWLRLCGVDDAD